jgi:hypothetical protein
VNDTFSTTTPPTVTDYLSCGDEARSWELLESLVTQRLEPVAESFIRGKLQASLRADDDRQCNDDAMDLVSEVKALVIAKLTRLRERNESIVNLEAYTMAVTVNVYNGYLRKKYPRRLQLKDQLRYIVSHDRRFSLWRSESGEWSCSMRGGEEKALPGSRAELYDELSARSTLEGHSAERMKLSDLLKVVLIASRGPIRFADVVTLIYRLRNVREPLAADGYDAAVSMETRPDDMVARLETKDDLRRLWNELKLLPLRHRAAVLLNLKNNRGDGLITLLPLIGIASIRQIADVLEFPPEEFGLAWSGLPWDDHAIAEHLRVTRQQVINLRQSARAKLRRALVR